VVTLSPLLTFNLTTLTTLSQTIKQYSQRLEVNRRQKWHQHSYTVASEFIDSFTAASQTREQRPDQLTRTALRGVGVASNFEFLM